MAQILSDLATQLQQQAQPNKQLTFNSSLITGSDNYLAVLMLLNSAQSFTVMFQNVTTDIVFNSTNNTLTINGGGTLYNTSINIQLVFTGTLVSSASCNLTSSFNTFPLITLNNESLIPANTLSNTALNLFNFNNASLNIQAPAKASPGSNNIFATYELTVATGQLSTPIIIIDALGLSLQSAGLSFKRTINTAGVFDYSLAINGGVNIGPMLLNLSLTAPVGYYSSGVWIFQFDSGSGNQAVDLGNLVQVLAGTNPFSNLPPGLGALSGLGKLTLQSLQVKFGFNDPSSPVVYSVYVLVTVFDQSNNNSWVVMDSPVKFVIADAGFSITVLNPFDSGARNTSVLIYGDFVIGSTTPQLLLDTNMTLDINTGNWEATIEGDFKNNGFGNLFQSLPLLSDQQAPDFPVGLEIDEIKLNDLTIAYNAAPTSRTISYINFDIQTVIKFTISLGPLQLSIQDPFASFYITNPASAANRELTGVVGGTLGIGSVDFNLSASKDAPDAGWTFKGEMDPDDVIKFGDIVTTFLSSLGIQNIPQWVQNNLPVIKTFRASVTTAPSSNPSMGSSYALAGSADWKLNFDSFIHDIDLKADIDITYNSVTKAFQGNIIGYTTLNDVLTIGLGYTFSSDPAAAGLITVLFDGIKGTYNTTNGDINITFQNQSLGGIITHLMQTIDASFALYPPWDFLNDINLSGFSMTFNVPKKTASITYAASIDLGFLKINGFTLKKAPDPVTGISSVTINIDGTFLGMSTNSPASPLNGPKDITKLPTVPGKGNEYFDLSLLALGQRVSIQNAATVKSVEDVIQSLIKLDNPPQGQIPLSPGKTGVLWYNPDANWLMATKFGILKLPQSGGDASATAKPSYAIEMDIVFNDPLIYGLVIQMSGDKVKIFDGLKFEILYKKISDTVGVYQIDLTLPASVRNLDFGAFSIVLPSVGIMIYTNGDFLIDVGFPYNQDFSRSFTVSAIIMGIPVLGSGGFYFGKLSSATSKQVPQSTKGQFNPVMVFGVGMQLGLGYTFNKGILAAGFSLTILGILEGVIAKWHAYNNVEQGSKTQVQDAYYFWIRGTIGIMGKLYGSIDFAIIKASLNVTIYATLSTTYESYRKMPIVLSVGISVELSVKIDLWLFSITIHLSFSAQLREEFSIGQDHLQDAPWYDGTQTLQRFYSRRLLAEKLAPADFHFDYMIGDGNPQTLNIYFAPHLTITGTPGESENAQQAEYVAMMYIETIPQNSVPLGNTSFEYLSQQVFRWMVSSYIATAQVTPQQVDDLVVSDKQLNNIFQFLTDNSLPLQTSDIINFIGRIFKVDILAPKKGTTKQDLSVTVFPVFPFLELTVPAYGNVPSIDRSFDDYIQCTSAYIQTLKTYFDQVMVSPGDSNDSADALSSEDPTLFSIADIVFRDFFVLIARQTIQEARDILKTYSYTVDVNDSINSILHNLNSIQSTDGSHNILTAEEIAELNSSVALTGNKSIIIGNIQHVVAAGDSITGIAVTYGMSDMAFATLFADQPVLATGALVEYNQTTYTIKAQDTITTVAAFFAVDIATLVANSNMIQAQGILATGAILCIAGYNYKVQNKDTLSIIQSHYNSVSVADIFSQNINKQGLIQAGTKITISNLEPYITMPGDTFTSIVAAFPKTGITDIITAIENLDGLLIPLATLYIPLFTYTTNADNSDTLASIALKFFITPEDIVAVPANTSITSVFYTSQTFTPVLKLPSLECSSMSAIVAQMLKGNAINQLSGMSSRFLLHGLRLPVTADLHFPSGAPCIGTDYCSLYRLTGQQFPLPAAFTSTDYPITLKTTGNTYNWLSFGSDNATQIDVVLQQADEVETLITNVLSYAIKTGIKPNVLSLEPLPVYAESGATFTLRTATKINTAQVMNLPSGGDVPQGISPLIWGFPPALTNLINQKKQLLPKMQLLIGSGGIVDDTTPVSTYNGWGTNVAITLKQLPAGNAFCYELIGTDETGALLLQRLLAFCDAYKKQHSNDFGAALYLLYQNNGALNYDGNDAITTFIVNSNLSTDTNPPPNGLAARMLKATHTQGFLNSFTDFIKLLWQCSTVRSGGYYLYYNNNGVGLPNSLFGEGQSATINLTILYNNIIEGTEPGIVYDFMNCVVTGDNIDVSKNSVIAQSQEQSTVYTISGTESLTQIVSLYNLLLGDLLQLNNTVAINTSSLHLRIPSVYYQMKENDTLTSVATYFSNNAQNPITAQQLQQQNPGVTPGPMVLLFIGDIIYNVSNAVGSPGNTFSSIAAYYGVSLNALAYANKDVASVFSVNTKLTIDDQVVNKIPALPPGAGGFMLTREDPGQIPAKDDSLYPEKYLLNTFNLLSYIVSSNAYFNESIPGLPAGPSEKQPELTFRKKKIMGEGISSWYYSQAVMMCNYAKQRNMIDRGVNYPLVSANPYAGAGKIAQLYFDWQDMFGNNTTALLNAPAGVMNNLPVDMGYTDMLLPLLAWPSLYTYYAVWQDANNGNQSELRLGLLFDTSRYEVSASVDAETARKNATDDLAVYTTVYYQLNQLKDDNVSPAVNFIMSTSLLTQNQVTLNSSQYQSIINFVNEVYVYLYTKTTAGNINTLVPQAPAELGIVFPLTITVINSNDIFEIGVQLAIQRDIDFVHPDFKDVKETWYADSPLSPPTFPNYTNITTMAGFAEAFETTLQENNQFVIKVATSMPDIESGSSSKTVWAVRWGLQQSNTIYYSITNTPFYYAVPPLANTSVSYPSVSVAPYQTGVGMVPSAAVNKSFTGIDMDTWGRSFLEALELVLSPDYSVPAFLAGKIENAGTDYVQLLLDAKKDIAEAISNNVTNVFAGQQPTPGQLSNATERMKQQFLNNLVNAYTIDTAIQFPVTVSSPYPGQGENAAPNLYGTPQASQQLTANDDSNTRPYSLSTAKIALADTSKKDTEAFLTVLFTANNVTDTNVMQLNITYNATHIEHQIATIPGLDDYKSSTWLNFVIPPDSNEIGTIDIPVLLRAYPTPPSLLSQQSIPLTNVTSIAEGKTWDYQLVYSSDHLLQDQINAFIEFNLVPDPQDKLRGDGTKDLFEALAQFISVYSQIKTDLTTYLLMMNPETSITDSVYKNGLAAIQAFQSCVNDVANGWKRWKEIKGTVNAPDVKAGARFDFTITEVNDNGNAEVTVSGNPSDIAGLEIPIIKIDPNNFTPDPQTPSLSYHYLKTNPPNQGQMLTWKEASSIMPRTLCINDLDILRFQNAQAAVYLVRNAIFSGRTTNDDFVYKTPYVKFANTLVPLLSSDSPILISGNDTLPLAAQLSAMFRNLFTNDSSATELVKVSCSYSYSINDLVSPVTLPVLLATPFDFNLPGDYTIPAGGCVPPDASKNSNTSDPLVCRLAYAIQQWFKINAPSTKSGMFIFSVSVFSKLDPDNQLPVVSFSNLQLPVDKIQW